jgi:hypothetical protein
MYNSTSFKHSHLQFVEEAIQEALKSPNSSKHAALLIHNNKIISRGHNQFRGLVSDSVRLCPLCS